MDELEKTIRDLVERKNGAPDGSAKQAFYERQLRALRYRYEEAGGLIEHYDPMGWGCYCRPLEDRECPSGTLVPLSRRGRRSGSTT
jgi:hypothetical protein